MSTPNRTGVTDAPENHAAAAAIIEAFGFDDAVALIDKARAKASDDLKDKPGADRVDLPITKGDGSDLRVIATLSFLREGGK